MKQLNRNNPLLWRNLSTAFYILLDNTTPLLIPKQMFQNSRVLFSNSSIQTQITFRRSSPFAVWQGSVDGHIAWKPNDMQYFQLELSWQIHLRSAATTQIHWPRFRALLQWRYELHYGKQLQHQVDISHNTLPKISLATKNVNKQIIREHLWKALSTCMLEQHEC